MEKHPLFARTTEDLEGNPMVEAFRQIKEEDKNNYELVLMYKEEGNEWIKDKKKKKNLTEAYNNYSHSLMLLRKVYDDYYQFHSSSTNSNDKINNRKEGNSEDKKKDNEYIKTLSREEIDKTHSQILSNRALASLLLTNYGSCKNDCLAAIKLLPTNMKAYSRLCKSLYQLKYYEDCITYCEQAITTEAKITNTTSTNSISTEIQQILDKSQELLKKENGIKQNRELVIQQQRETKWKSIYEVATKEKVTLGYYNPESKKPIQLGDSVAFCETNDEGTSSSYWPIIVLYPQYNQLDIIQAASLDEMLVEYISALLPEDETNSKSSNPALSWDQKNEYHGSNVVVYCMLSTSPPIANINQWMDACKEYSVVNEGDNASIGDTLNFEKVKNKAVQRQKEYDSIKYLQRETQPSYYNIHLGCTIRRILTAPLNIIAGGVLTLMVFPKSNGNKAHAKFIKDNEKEGRIITVLNPL